MCLTLIPVSAKQARVSFVTSISRTRYLPRELSVNGFSSFKNPARRKFFLSNPDRFTIIVPPILSLSRLALRAAAFIATKTSALSPGVKTSTLPKFN